MCNWPIVNFIYIYYVGKVYDCLQKCQFYIPLFKLKENLFLVIQTKATDIGYLSLWVGHLFLKLKLDGWEALLFDRKTVSIHTTLQKKIYVGMNLVLRDCVNISSCSQYHPFYLEENRSHFTVHPDKKGQKKGHIYNSISLKAHHHTREVTPLYVLISWVIYSTWLLDCVVFLYIYICTQVSLVYLYIYLIMYQYLHIYYLLFIYLLISVLFIMYLWVCILIIINFCE